MKENQAVTHGIANKGFSGMRRVVAGFNFSCNLIGNRFVIPHDTIPSNVTANVKKTPTYNETYTDWIIEFFFFELFLSNERF